MFLSSADFFKIKKILSGIPSVSNSLDPDQARQKMLGLIWVQTVSKGHQETTLAGKELNVKIMPKHIHNSSCSLFGQLSNPFVQHKSS